MGPVGDFLESYGVRYVNSLLFLAARISWVKHLQLSGWIRFRIDW